MVCLRCGYCCINSMVVIIKPEYVEVADLKNEEHFMVKMDGIECPHLSWNDRQAICALHNYPWYKKTPCYSHGQIEESKDCDCRMGRYLLDRGENVRIRMNKVK